MNSGTRGILMTGFFRTGSTFVFSSLRADSRLRCYYEPYHPMMADYLAPEREGKPDADAAFLGHTIDGDYFAEYRSLDLQQMRSYLKIDERPTAYPVLAGTSDGEDIKGYIDFLIDTAIDAGKIPFLQCNRWNLVLPWLRERYPGFAIILITRSSISVALSLYGLARKEGKKLELLSSVADYWGIAETVRNIAAFYEFDYEAVGKLNCLQKIHFIVRFAELYMSQSADITLNYDRFGQESGLFFDRLERYLDMALPACRDYVSSCWRQEGDKSRVAESIKGYLELPEAILAAWGEGRSKNCW